MKFVIHNLFLQSSVFTQDYQQVYDPCFQIKFVDFPPIIIKGQKSLKQEDFEIDPEFIEAKEKELILAKKKQEEFEDQFKQMAQNAKFEPIPTMKTSQTKLQKATDTEKREKNSKDMLKSIQDPNKKKQNASIDQATGLKVFEKIKPKEKVVQIDDPNKINRGFGIGKSLTLMLEKKIMESYLGEYALVIDFFDTFEQVSNKFVGIGQSLMSLQKFVEEIAIEKTFEKFMRNTFKMTNKNKELVGWFDMSISIICRPSERLNSQISDVYDDKQQKEDLSAEEEKKQQQQQNDKQGKEKIPGLDIKAVNDQQQKMKIQVLDKSPDNTPNSQQQNKTMLLTPHQNSDKSSLNVAISDLKTPPHIQQNNEKKQQQKENNNPNQKQNKQQQDESHSYNEEFESISNIKDSYSQGPTPQRNITNRKYEDNHKIEQSQDESYQQDFEQESQSQSNVKIQKKSTNIPKIQQSMQESVLEDYGNEQFEDFEQSQIQASKSKSDLKQQMNSGRDKFNKSQNEDIQSEYDQEMFESASQSIQYSKVKPGAQRVISSQK